MSDPAHLAAHAVQFTRGARAGRHDAGKRTANHHTFEQFSRKPLTTPREEPPMPTPPTIPPMIPPLTNVIETLTKLVNRYISDGQYGRAIIVLRSLEQLQIEQEERAGAAAEQARDLFTPPAGPTGNGDVDLRRLADEVRRTATVVPLVRVPTRADQPRDVETTKVIQVPPAGSHAPNYCTTPVDRGGNECGAVVAWSHQGPGVPGWYHVDPEITDHDAEVQP